MSRKLDVSLRVAPLVVEVGVASRSNRLHVVFMAQTARDVGAAGAVRREESELCRPWAWGGVGL